VKLRNAWIGLALTAIVCACATTSEPKPVSEEKRVSNVIAAWCKAIMARDIEQLMTLYADDYADANLRTKKQLTDFLTKAASDGYLDKAEVNLTKSKTALNDNAATVGPVYLAAAFGKTKLDFTLKKYDGAWLISAMEAEEQD